MPTEMKAQLLNSADPIIRYKAAVLLDGLDPHSQAAAALRGQVRESPRVQKLLAARGPDGKFPPNAYHKWTGAHWVLAILSDIGYPAGDGDLADLFAAEYAWLLGEKHTKRIPTIAGRVRRCMSQETYGLFASIRLGNLGDEAHELARRAISWQWPDGGWNCDKRPEAHHSSFHESLIPLRAIGLYAQVTGDPAAKACTERAAEFFLRHELYKRESDGEVIDPHMVELYYPAFWHFNILEALKVMKELGFIHDPRCKPALDLLASRRLPDGGFPADGRWYRTTNPNPKISGYSPTDWGPTGKTRANEYVSVDALYVLGE